MATCDCERGANGLGLIRECDCDIEWASALIGIPAATLSALRSGEMVAVPREPTEAMKKAGSRALSGWIAPAMHADDAYCAMLAAAKDARHD